MECCDATGNTLIIISCQRIYSPNHVKFTLVMNVYTLGRTWFSNFRVLGVRQNSRINKGQTWFSCSLYSFHSEQAEQKSSALEHLCWLTPEYSVFRGGADRTVTWPAPKKMADHCLHVRKYFVSLDLFRSAQFYLFMWLFWRTPSTLKIAKSSPPK